MGNECAMTRNGSLGEAATPEFATDCTSCMLVRVVVWLGDKPLAVALHTGLIGWRGKRLHLDGKLAHGRTSCVITWCAIHRVTGMEAVAVMASAINAMTAHMIFAASGR